MRGTKAAAGALGWLLGGLLLLGRQQEASGQVIEGFAVEPPDSVSGFPF
jgi:hypothetical protein